MTSHWRPDKDKSDLNEVLTHNFGCGKYYIEYLNYTFPPSHHDTHKSANPPNDCGQNQHMRKTIEFHL